MKKGLHPSNWRHDCQVTCSCGHTFTTGGVQATIQVDICSKCHPFFTGEMRFVDRQGRVDKFQKKMQAAAAAAASQKTAKKTTKKTAPKSYKQILVEQQNELKAKQQSAAAPAAPAASAQPAA